jgi:hypothetical protein
MLIFEVESTGVDVGKLAALAAFLAGRAEDTDAKKQISTSAFINLARNLGVAVTADAIGDLIAQPPLSNVLEPYEPMTNIIKFKGNTDVAPTMSVDKAEEIVSQNAKSAMKRGMNK